MLTAVLVSILLAASTAGASTVTVFAAASLTEAFRAISQDFEAAYPGTKVEFNFAGSTTLARQIVAGALADVFASADEESMRKAAAAGGIAGAPQVFARDRLVIIVPRGNPKRVTGLADLARADMTVALAAPAVAVGRDAREAFGKVGVPAPAGRSATDAKAVVTRVATGEADAGVAYATDASAGEGKVDAVAIPDAQNVVVRYPIATLKAAPNAAGARAFVAYVQSPSGQRVLEHAGFLAP